MNKISLMQRRENVTISEHWGKLQHESFVNVLLCVSWKNIQYNSLNIVQTYQRFFSKSAAFYIDTGNQIFLIYSY